MELTVVLAGIPVRLSLRSPAYAACFQPFWTEADPVAAVRQSLPHRNGIRCSAVQIEIPLIRHNRGKYRNCR